MTATTIRERSRMAELAVYFLRLGFLGFGGPVALVGQMERELVTDRKWLSKEQMRESIAICQSLPGPLAIQVGIYVARLRCGFWGALTVAVGIVSLAVLFRWKISNPVLIAATAVVGLIGYPLLQPA